MGAALAWVGARAHWALALGIVLCFVAPDLSHLLRPALPLLVALVLGLAVARIEIGVAARAALAPRAALGLVLLALALIPLSAVIYHAAATLIGLPAGLAAALVFLAAAPPVSSSGSLCFILGLDARRAIEITVVATLLTPLLGPMTIEILAPEAHALSPLELASNLGLMIAAGIALGLALRRTLGPERIAARADVFNGAAAIALVLLVLPLFAGVPALIAAEPGRAALALAVAVVANLGVNLAVRAALLKRMPAARAGAYGLVCGNRTVALYVAALPFDPHLALFVALYQIPVLLSPLVLRPLVGCTRN